MTSSSTREPFSAASRGTAMTSPSATRYCLPAARTTAYTDAPSVDVDDSRQKVVARRATLKESVHESGSAGPRPARLGPVGCAAVSVAEVGRVGLRTAATDDGREIL